MFATVLSKGLQPPQIEINPGEDTLLNEADGVCILSPAPAKCAIVTTSFETDEDGEIIPTSFDRNLCKSSESLYLYVIPDNSLKYVQEKCQKGKSLPRGEACHTNLTGGREAYCGGEFCFINESSVYYNGLSGRYPPRDEDELFAVGNIFKGYGYQATCLTWDFETNTARIKIRKNLVKKL